VNGRTVGDPHTPVLTVPRFPIDESHVLQFARAVGDPNPVYCDASHAATTPVGALLAPPTFMMASDHFDPGYARRPQPGEKWFGSGREPSGTAPAAGAAAAGASQQTGFHAEQIFVYHRHPVVGDVLAGRTHAGSVWHKDGRRGGRLRFRETITDYVDQHGRPVITATFVGVTTEKLVDGAPTESATPAAPDAPAPAAGLDRLGRFTRGATTSSVLVDDLTRTQIVMYAGASGDFHPLHHDATFATWMGYPGIFAHGMLTMGLTSRLVTDVVGDATLTRWAAQFRGTVWPGDTLTATATVVALRDGDPPEVDLEVRTTNQHGAEVLRGQATAHIG
jgi:acyl dehydratase